VWGSAWDATRDAETSASDFVQLVLRNVGAETESTTLRTVLSQAQTTASMYVAPKHRAETLATVGDTFWKLAQEAEPGSDSQFQFVRAFAAVAHTPEQLDTVQRVLDEEITLDQLNIDTDLGWELLIALAAGGRAGTAEIEAALASDNTATGAQSAAHAKAALPTLADKTAAWKSIVEETGASNLIVRATGLGFVRASDPAVLEEFVPRYFDALTGIWESRSYAIASGIINGFYPAPLANQALADASREWLAAHPETPALRRLIIENLAGVERALRVQARDAG
jgi:aminopeptidase N